MTTDERYITACREAGHAVAALMRGGGEITSITIEPTADYLGYTWTRIKPFDRAFIIYAGPWAEARAHGPIRRLTDATGTAACSKTL